MEPASDLLSFFKSSFPANVPYKSLELTYPQPQPQQQQQPQQHQPQGGNSFGLGVGSSGGELLPSGLNPQPLSSALREAGLDMRRDQANDQADPWQAALSETQMGQLAPPAKAGDQLQPLIKLGGQEGEETSGQSQKKWFLLAAGVAAAATLGIIMVLVGVHYIMKFFAKRKAAKISSLVPQPPHASMVDIGKRRADDSKGFFEKYSTPGPSLVDNLRMTQPSEEDQAWLDSAPSSSPPREQAHHLLPEASDEASLPKDLFVREDPD